MKQEIAKAWSEALRSGKYEQGKTVLKTEDGKFCCLGVLCHVVDPDGWALDEFGFTAHRGIRGVPHESVVREAGMQLGNPSVSSKFVPYAIKLSTLNDVYHATFDYIADIIDANWESL